MKVERIDNIYVGDDCCQIMLPSMNNITVLNKDGILYHRNEVTPYYINKYLDDYRKNAFPYSSIPEHNKFIFPNKVRYINQLFEYNCDYFVFGTGYECGVQLNALKDNDEAIFIKSNIYEGKCMESYKKYDELEKLFIGSDDEQVFNIDLDGRIINDKVIPSQELIASFIRMCLIVDNIIEDDCYIDYYDLNNFDLDISLLDIPVINVRIKNNKISLKKVSIDILGINSYHVLEEDIPINKYNLEWIKGKNIRTNNTFNPKISRLLNPDIPYENIVRENNKVKKLKK